VELQEDVIQILEEHQAFAFQRQDVAAAGRRGAKDTPGEVRKQLIRER
jgi:hypothetical protein